MVVQGKKTAAESARGQALESKASIRRYLEEVPLSADERGIVGRRSGQDRWTDQEVVFHTLS